LIRILIVDDAAAMRRSIALTLSRQEDLQVAGEAADAEEGIERARELQPDVVILDISLPGMSGIRAAPEIVAAAPGARILFVSQHDSAQMVKTAFGAGGHGYVVKSDAGRELLEAVRAVQAGGRFLSSQLARAQRQGTPAELGWESP
jgi:DNA-binding NarL/FixJ family response regulator